MATLTLTFKDKVIRTHRLETDVAVHIGRDESNEIHIDSLAVAPTHAVVVRNGEGETVVKQLNDEFPLTVNDMAGHEHQLNEGDRISIGKHALQYSDAATLQELSQNSQIHPSWLDQEIGLSVTIPEANLQILNGKHIGRLIPLKRALTRLGKTGSGIVVIAKRKEGYFLSPLESEQAISVNSRSLGQQTVRLSHGDTLKIDETAMQFFVEQ
jgi:pSer/pThr/pTyr-binding forkhead associated (FHA) protein